MELMMSVVAVKQLIEANSGGLMETGAKESDCIDLSNSTIIVALLECECIPDLIQLCGDPLLNNVTFASQKQCLSEHACTHADVCQTWKDAHCVGGTIPTSLLELSGNHTPANYHGHDSEANHVVLHHLYERKEKM